MLEKLQNRVKTLLICILPAPKLQIKSKIQMDDGIWSCYKPKEMWISNFSSVPNQTILELVHTHESESAQPVQEAGAYNTTLFSV